MSWIKQYFERKVQRLISQFGNRALKQVPFTQNGTLIAWQHIKSRAAPWSEVTVVKWFTERQKSQVDKFILFARETFYNPPPLLSVLCKCSVHILVPFFVLEWNRIFSVWVRERERKNSMDPLFNLMFITR